MTKDYYLIKGGKKLSGTVQVSGSKNAALPLLAASLVVEGVTTLHNVPRIADVENFLEVFTALGVGVQWQSDVLQIDATCINDTDLFAVEALPKMRASLLLLTPLLYRLGHVQMPFAGGCTLGARSANVHLEGLVALGAEVIESDMALHLKLPKGRFVGGRVVLSEASVTATENAIVAAAVADGSSEIRMAAAEPHVQNLCDFFTKNSKYRHLEVSDERSESERSLVDKGDFSDSFVPQSLRTGSGQAHQNGDFVAGIGSHFLQITGGFEEKEAEMTVVGDYLEAGTFILAGVLTDSQITVKGVPEQHLDSFLQKLAETGARFTIDGDEITTLSRDRELTATNIQTGIFPKFATDLHPQFAVLLTQCAGTSKVFETMFERKFAYLFELEKLGANVELLNPHQFLIKGPALLQGNVVASQDIRAGAAVLLAALVAEGESEVTNIHYIERGYQDLEEKLTSLGASIERRTMA